MKTPKVFISYAWATKDGDDWVLQLAEELTQNGVHAILDQWDLREGQDAFKFMEQSVGNDEISKVIIVSDQNYCERANNRVGGAGTEAQILSPKIYESAEQTKFVVCPRELNDKGEPAVPTFFQGRIHIDFTSDEARSLNFESLLRWIFDKPLRVRPHLGTAPDFTAQESSGHQPSELAAIVRITNRIKASDSPKPSLTRDAIQEITKFAQSIRQPIPKDTEVDEVILDRIHLTKPFRDVSIKLLETIIAEYEELFLTEELHSFFEELLSQRESFPKDRNHFHKWETDPIALLIHEFFLLSISASISARKINLFRALVEQHYFPDSYPQADQEMSFLDVRPYLESLEHHKTKNKINRISIHADLIRDRCTDEQQFSKFMEADALLYLESIKKDRMWKWYPVSLLFWRSFTSRMPLIRRGKSEKYASIIASILGFKSADDLKAKYLIIEANPENLVRMDYQKLSPSSLLRLDEFGTID